MVGVFQTFHDGRSAGVLTQLNTMVPISLHSVVNDRMNDFTFVSSDACWSHTPNRLGCYKDTNFVGGI